jgi:hypothetical protein
MEPIERLKLLVNHFGDDTDIKTFNDIEKQLLKISSYDCHGCTRHISGSCCIEPGNHCIRRADDYYGKK